MGVLAIIVAAITALAVVYVLIPVAADTYLRYREKRLLRCPATGEEAAVGVDARRAALGSVFARTLLRVRSCSFWPEREQCRQDCLESPAPPPAAAAERGEGQG